MSDTFVPSLCKTHSEKFYEQARNAGACPVCDLDHAAEVARLQERVRVLEDGIKGALDNLGVPIPGYPAPVAEAVRLLNLAVRAERKRKEGK